MPSVAELYSVSYRSRAVQALTAAEWQQLEVSALNRNVSLGVTGALLYDGEFFMQTIEGPRQAVVDLMALIQRDPRHEGIIPFGVRPIPARCFPGSPLKLIGPDRVVHQMLSQFGYLDLRDQSTLEELNGLMLAA